jgi:hypothetical protein
VVNTIRPILTTSHVFLVIAFLFLGQASFAQVNTISFSIDSKKLFVGQFANDVPDYTMGVGDIDGDGKQDVVVRVWSEGNRDGGDGYKQFESWMFAYTLKGKKLFEFNTKGAWGKDNIADPTAMAPMTIWDFDHDGKDEVLSRQDHDLVLLGYNGSGVQVEARKRLDGFKRYILSTIAFLDGFARPPYIVVAYGSNSKVIAFDAKLNEKRRFDKSKYYGCYPGSSFIQGYDLDNDQRDELLYGSLLLNEDLTIYIDGTQFGGSPYTGIATRSFIADIVPDNPGVEWFVIRYAFGGSPAPPVSWNGPYLIGVRPNMQNRLLWRWDNAANGFLAWGRLHRGWVGNVTKASGIEMWMTGVPWRSQAEWEQKKDSGERHGKPESWFLFDAKGNILGSQLDSGYETVYPVAWDDDPEHEVFNYRNGKLKEQFGSASKVIAKLQSHSGSGEVTITDFLGDWHEEIIITDWHRIYVYQNATSTKYMDWPPLRNGHNYRVHQASAGVGLPKPYPPDPDWPNLGSPPPVVDSTPPSSPQGIKVRRP